MSADPPRLATRLLEARLADEWRDFVLGDLEEEFHARANVSAARARWWFRWQAIRCLVMPPRERYRPLPSISTGDSIVRTVLSDLRYALRLLLRTPSFALAVIAVLALGIGANTAIFSIVNAVLLRPLPFDEPDRLVRLFHEPPQNAFPGIHRFSVSAANYYDWQRAAQTFEAMAIYRFRPFTLTGGSNPEAVVAGAVGSGFFGVVRTKPQLGRVFLPEEDSPGRGYVVILSDRFWKTHLGGDPNVVGRTLTLDGESYSIVGVMPARFSIASWGVTARDLWVPTAFSEADRAVRDNHNDQVIARLKPGVQPAQSQSEMDLISARLEREYPKENTGWGATVVPLQELIVGDIRLTLLMLFAAVALVLLIACANVANLLYTRALGRRKEMAIRSALGAGRARVFQQQLIEALVLASAGGIAGLVIARTMLAAGSALLADQLPRADEISIDARVLVFVAVASILTGMLAGALPALRTGRHDLNDTLKEGGRSEGAIGIRTRRVLIVCEVALSVVLLMGAAVMLRSLLALRNVDGGYDPHNVLTMRVSLPETKYKTPAERSAFFDTALARLRALPGVRAAGFIDDLPAQGGSVQPIVLEGHAELLPRDQPTVSVRKISPGLVKALQIPVVEGRDVSDTDVEVILVSRSAAKLLWRDDNPIGRRVTLPLQSKTVQKTVIGIVGDVKQGELSEMAMPCVYEYTRERAWSSLAFAVRTVTPPSVLTNSATGVVRTLDPEQPVQSVRTMDDILDEMVSSQRLSALLLGLFASVAIALATVGIYSVLSYIVRGRSREIGIRTALGARTADVVRLVVVEGMMPAIMGIAAGTIAALASATVLQKLLFGVSASDPVMLGLVAVALAAVALVATLVPAYRASKLDPVQVLRAP